MPCELLSAICGARIRGRKLADPELHEVLSTNRKASGGQPCIYILELANKAGMAPTVREMHQFLERARAYHSPASQDEIEFAVKVDGVASRLDSAERAAIRDGHRRYLPSPNSRDRLRVLIYALENSLNRCKTEMTVSLFCSAMLATRIMASDTSKNSTRNMSCRTS